MCKSSKRISATKSLIFEFCPNTEPKESKNLDGRTKHTLVRNTFGRNVSSNDRTSALPKLRTLSSATNFATGTLNPDYSANLPSWPGIKDKQFATRSAIKAETSKSIRQTTKQTKNLWQGKRPIEDPKNRKLYDTLEQINRSMGDHGKSFLKNGTKPINENLSRTIVENEATRMKNRIFPKRNFETTEWNDGLDELLRRRSMKNKITKNVDLASDFTKKSSINGDSTVAPEVANYRSTGNLGSIDVSNKSYENFSLFDETGTKIDPKKFEKDSKFSKYFDDEKVENETMNERFDDWSEKASKENVEDLLARLSIRYGGGCETFKDKTMDDMATECILNIDNDEKIQTLDIPECTKHIATETEKIGEKNYSLADRDCGEIETNKTKNRSGIWDSANFTKIILNDSKDRIPEHFHSQILKSDYLRKDPDFIAM